MKWYNNNEIEFIQERANEQIEQILDALGLDYTERVDYFTMPCAIHGGDNERALTWFRRSPHFVCNTKHCEHTEITGKSNSVFGLIRGVMSSQSGRKWTFQQAVNFAAEILGISGQTLDPKTEAELDIDTAIKKYKQRLSKQPQKKGILLSDIVSRLERDTVYYPKRGISDYIISKYHISYCNNPSQPFFQRSFFPVLDSTGKYVVGWTARTIFDKCDKCGVYHDTKLECPQDKENPKYAKWRHSTTLKSEYCLYNFCHAKPYISKYKTAIIVEGPGDCWSFEMAEIKNSVAMFGLNLSVQQRKMLQQAGALTIIFAVDNDEAGKRAMTKLYDELQWLFRVFFITPSGTKDIGEMLPQDIRDKLLPVIKTFSRDFERTSL